MIVVILLEDYGDSCFSVFSYSFEFKTGPLSAAFQTKASFCSKQDLLHTYRFCFSRFENLFGIYANAFHLNTSYLDRSTNLYFSFLPHTASWISCKHVRFFIIKHIKHTLIKELL